MSRPLLINALQESQLFTTSLASDVQVSQGHLKVGIMTPTKLSSISDIINVKYQAEVGQVVTVSTPTTLVPAGSTSYTIEIGDTNRSRNGIQEQLKRYTYITPADVTSLGGTAALQREAINAALIAKINADTSYNFVTAATSTGGTGFTVTDATGYYPVNKQGMTVRQGASTVQTCRNSDGSGFVGTEASITTPAKYGSGIGSQLAEYKPVIDQMWGNLIQGYLGGTAPKTAAGAYATSGQNYDSFAVVSLTESPTSTGHGQIAYLPKIQIAYVDNGTGTSTSNLTGFGAFENAFLNVLFGQYKNDPASIWFMNNTIPTCGGLATGLPSGTSLAENTINFGNGSATHYYPLGTATLVALIADADGVGIVLDATAGEGVELSAPTFTNSQKEFVVGKTAASIYTKVKIDDVSGLNPYWCGFRKKAAADTTYTSYTDYAFIGLGNATGDIFTSTENDGGGNTNTDTTQNWADGETHTLEVRVDINGAVTFFLDGYAPTVTQTFSFDTGDSLIPVFGYGLQTADIGTPRISQGAFITTDQWRPVNY